MPGTKEIRSKIASVKSTQKITKAMQMVATSKMRRAQERMRLARPYAVKMRNVIGHLTQANPDYRHPLLATRETKAVGLIVISTDRGLAGALNANVFKQTLLLVREWQDKGAEVSLSRARRQGTQLLPTPAAADPRQPLGTGRLPHVKDLIGAGQSDAGRVQRGQDRPAVRVHALRNTMTQTPDVLQLLPIETIDTEGLQQHWDYIYEPDAAGILDALLMRYIESQVYRGAVENVASEMAARMVAMKAATDNADKLIQELQLIYNKARQATITKELSEIVGGAAAV